MLKTTHILVSRERSQIETELEASFVVPEGAGEDKRPQSSFLAVNSMN